MVVFARLVPLVVLLVIRLMFVIVVLVDIICFRVIVWPVLPIVVLVPMVQHALLVPKASWYPIYVCYARTLPTKVLRVALLV